MQAVILAAGRGTRLRPVSCHVPKPMIPVVDKPVMEFLVELLARHEIRQIMVNTSYLGDAIEAYFRDGRRFGVEMAYSFEGRVEAGRIIDEPLGSAGALRRIQDQWGLLDETFVVLCGDAVVDVDLGELVRQHRRRKAVATMALARVDRSAVASYGVVVTDHDGRVRQFQEKPKPEEALSTLANTGIYVFEPEVARMIPGGRVSDIGGELFPALAALGEPLYGVEVPFQWLDIGRLSDFHRVTMLALRGRVNGYRPRGDQPVPNVWCGLGVSLGTRTFRPPVYLGPGTIVEPGAVLEGPVSVGAGCIVEEGAHIAHSVVLDHTRVHADAQLQDAVAGPDFCVQKWATGQAGLDHDGGRVSDARNVATAQHLGRGTWQVAVAIA